MKTLILSLLGSAMLVSAPALAGDDYRSGTTDVPEAADASPGHDDDRYRGTDGASAGERGYDDDDDDDDDLPGRMDDDGDDDDD